MFANMRSKRAALAKRFSPFRVFVSSRGCRGNSFKFLRNSNFLRVRIGRPVCTANFVDAFLSSNWMVELSNRAALVGRSVLFKKSVKVQCLDYKVSVVLLAHQKVDRSRPNRVARPCKSPAHLNKRREIDLSTL